MSRFNKKDKLYNQNSIANYIHRKALKFINVILNKKFSSSFFLVVILYGSFMTFRSHDPLTLNQSDEMKIPTHHNTKVSTNLFSADLLSTTAPVPSNNRNEKLNLTENTIPLSRRDKIEDPSLLYEPKNVNFFWKKMGDRPFLGEIYAELKQYKNILDIGAREYNRVCKDLINSTSTMYYQVEPTPLPNEMMNNDGFLNCNVQELSVVFPQTKKYFDVVVDFGVFGFVPVHNWKYNKFNTTKDMVDDMIAYVQNVRYVLKENGLWILKLDQGWVPDEALGDTDENKIFDDIILPYFYKGSFGHRKIGTKVKSYRFMFLYKKNID